MMAENEDDDFVRLLAEKQHREFMSAIRTFVATLEKLESNDANTTRSIQKHSQSVVDLMERLTQQKPPEAPAVNLNQEAVIAELKNLCYEFKELTHAINNKKPVQWDFSIERGFGNNIDKITAKPK